MEKKVTLFSQKELDKLNTETLEFIHREANLYLENLLSISRRIGERTFSLLGIIAASCSFLIAAVSCFSSNREIAVFMLILGLSLLYGFFLER